MVKVKLYLSNGNELLAEIDEGDLPEFLDDIKRDMINENVHTLKDGRLVSGKHIVWVKPLEEAP